MPLKNGPHHSPNSLTERSIAPVVDIVLKIKTDKRPSGIRLQPDGVGLDFKWDGRYAFVNVPRIDYHAVLEVVE